MDTSALEHRYRTRESLSWNSRLRRALEPPAPFVMNPREPKNFPLGRWNLYIGGADRRVARYLNLDLFPMPGVDVAADAECDAVLEHVPDPEQVLREMRRVLSPAGYLHLVTPFCLPTASNSSPPG